MPILGVLSSPLGHGFGNDPEDIMDPKNLATLVQITDDRRR